MNHTTAYYQNFTMPTRGEAGGFPSGTESFYSFDLGNIHFLSLDSYGLEDKKFMLYDTLGRQAQWIKKDLATNNNKGWVIAYWHHPPYTMGSHNSDEESELGEIREKVLPILERYGVDLVLCGHSHVYERSKLMKGYYGKEADFEEVKYNINSSSAKDDGTPNSAPYVKKISGPGTVYVVTGSAGPVGGIQKSFPHAAMYYSNGTIGGSTMLEVKGNKLTLKWICADGVIRDQFSMLKEK
jgi:3',5'-cyclic AMP phosphodiesterase CpdA